MLVGSGGLRQRAAANPRPVLSSASGCRDALPTRGGALVLPVAARHRQRQRPLLVRPTSRRLAWPPAALNDDGTEPGWDDWADESEAWGGWAPPASAASTSQASTAAAEPGGGGSSGTFSGRQGVTQHLQASTSGRGEQQEQQQRAEAAAPPLAARSVFQRYAGRGVAAPRVGVASASSHAIPPPPRPSGIPARYFTLGAVAAVALHYLVNFAGTLPVVRRLVQRFVWWSARGGPALPPPPSAPGSPRDAAGGGGTAALAVQYCEDEESVEWVNMCWRKAWRVYQRGIERWLADLLQPLFDSLVAEKMVPSFVQRLRIMEFTLDHEAPYFTNMRRRTSRKDSDLNGVVDVRYTGGARMLLLIEVGTGRWRIKIPVMVSDLDLEGKLWLKIRLAPMCPWIGTLGLGFVGAPNIKVQLAPYNRIRLMKIPILQAFLTKLLTVDLPELMVLPKRLEINIPPAVTAVAEAAVGRDAVMRAVASAVLQADALEHALLAALPLGPQGAAGGVSLPDLFTGELQVTLHEARDLPVWGFPWQSNPYCRMTLGSQAVQSKRDDDTSHAGQHRSPVWNQEFQFLVEDPSNQALDIWIGDSPMTGRTEVGRASFSLSQLAADGTADVWLPVESSMPGERTQGAVRLVISYKPFQEDEPTMDSGYRTAAEYGLAPPVGEITDIKTAADASSRAAVAASAAAAAVAVTKAAAARAAARLARGGGAGGKGSGSGMSWQQLQQQQQQQGSSGANGSLSQAPASASTSNGTGAAAAAAAAATAVAVAAVNGAAPGDGRAAAAAVPAAVPAAQRGNSTVEQLTAMAEAMQKLTAEVDGIVHSGTSVVPPGGKAAPGGSGTAAAGTAIDADVKVAAVEAVAAAEAAAISAVAAGDLAGANKVLQNAAAALQSTVAQLAAAEAKGSAVRAEAEAAEAAAPPATPAAAAATGAAARALTPQERAQQALAAAHVAAAQAADAAAVGARPSAAVDVRQPSPGEGDEAGDEGALSSSDEAVGLDAAPAAEAAAERGKGLPSYDAPPEEAQPWWLSAAALVPGVPRQGDADAAAGAAAEADGGVGMEPSTAQQLGQQQQQQQPGPVTDVVIPPDLPLDEITAEVLKSWKLRDTHVETLLQKAMEARRKQKERPWLQLLTVMSVASAVLLAAVLWHMEHMP